MTAEGIFRDRHSSTLRAPQAELDAYLRDPPQLSFVEPSDSGLDEPASPCSSALAASGPSRATTRG